MQTQPPVEAGAVPEDRFSASVLRTMDIEIEGLVALREALKGELGAATLRFVREVLALPGRVIVCGMGKSGHIGRKVAATLTSTGTPSLFMHPAEASHGDLGMVTSHDMILAFSWSGETKELGDIASYCQRYGVPLAVVTSRRDSWLGATADIVLELPGAKEACPHGLAPTTSTMLQLSLGDAIAIALLEQREFTPANFHRFHPGGKLGSSLRTVGQLMRPMPMVAFVKKEASMSEVVLQMTSQSLGSAFVVTDDMEVLGIVTDGDLRRHMTGDLLALPVSKVFTPNPYTCSPDILGVTALTIMTRHKVNALAVVENRKLVGILTMHMLLSAGIS